MSITLKESICRSRRLPRTDAVLMGRAELCAKVDRDLIEAVLVMGQPTASVAGMMGTTPRVVRRRLHRLGRRLTSRKFLDAARTLPYLLPHDADLARMAVCEGMSQRQMCRKLGVPSYVLRRSLDMLDAQIKTIRRLDRAGVLVETDRNEASSSGA